MQKIPFNRPVVAGREIEHIREAIEGGQLAGDGRFTQLCEDMIAYWTGAQSAHLTHSCTAALEMAALLLDLKPNDEVIMPSFTFVSTANAVALRGATPVFVDIDPKTLNIDPEQVAAAMNEKTRSIWPVHYAGVVADMEAILALAAPREIMVVEDAAQAYGSYRDGRPAGSFGHMAAFSFHETKNVISGEGGVLVANDQNLTLRAEIIREKGTNRRQFFRGAVDKYSWVDIGSSFLPGELVAAFLYGQLEKVNEINQDRTESWNTYHAAFQAAESRGIARPYIDNRCSHNAHMYYLLFPDFDSRTEFIASMRTEDIVTPFHYVPLHSSPMGRRIARTNGELTVTEDISNRLVRLPLYPGMKPQIERIISTAMRNIERILR